MDVRSTLGLNDNMSRVLKGIVRTLDIVIASMQRLDVQSTLVGDDALNLMRRQIQSAEAELKDLEQLLNEVGSNAPPEPRAFSGWIPKITAIYSGIQLIGMAIQKIGAIGNLSDEFVSVNARVGMINDGLQTQEQLQDKILQSANATRSSYKETANLISKIGMTGAITNNDEQIAFAEKVNKMLKIGGGTSSMNQSALLQLSQSLSSGVMQGDEFRSLMENTPALMNNIAKGMGVSQGELKKLASEGKLTTQAIIDSVNVMGDSIDEQFLKLPRTFGENKTVFVNMVGTWLAKLSSTENALGRLNEKFTQLTNFMASEDGAQFLNTISAGLNLIVSILIGFFDIIGNGIEFINEFGGIFEGVFAGIVVGALVMMISLLWQAIPPLLMQAGAWIVMNLPILLVATAIGIVIGTLIHFGITGQQIVGFVGGLFGGLIGFLVNIFFYFYNYIGQIAVFLHNIFIDPVFAIQNLFYGMISNVLKFFQTMVNGIIDGLNFIISAANKVGANVEQLQHQNFADKFGKLAKPTSSKNVKTWENKYVDIGDFANKGKDFGTKAFDTMSDKFSMKGLPGLGGNPGINSPFGENKNIGDVGKVGKVGSIEKDVNIADEDLKMLYEMVVGDRVNQINLTVETNAPQIVNNNSIASDMDAEDIIEKFKNILNEEENISVKDSY